MNTNHLILICTGSILLALMLIATVLQPDREAAAGKGFWLLVLIGTAGAALIICPFFTQAPR